MRSYTRQQIEILEAWAYTDNPASQIAKVFGVSRNAVIGLGHRLQVRMGATSRDHLRMFAKITVIDWGNVPPMPSHVTMPQKLRPQNMTATDRIAEAERQARARELARIEREDRAKLRREEQAKQDRARAKRLAKRIAEEQAREEKREARRRLTGVPLSELEHGMCKAVVGEWRGEPTYCGDVLAQRSYCAAHAALYYIPNGKYKRGGELIAPRLHALVS